MYGTTIRNYNENKSSKKENGFFSNRKAKKEKTKNEFQNTRYVKIENSKKKETKNLEKTASQDRINEGVSRKEFPIASVLFTVIITMMLLLMGTGIIGG